MVNRRRFLTRLGCVGVGLSALLMGGDSNEHSSQIFCDTETEENELAEKTTDSDGYISLTNINVKVAAYPIMRARFRVKKEKWEALPKGLSKQGLYNKIKKMGLQYEITALVDPANLPVVVGKAVSLYHQGYMNNEDVAAEFLKRAKGLVKSKTPELNLDPDLRFNESKKSALEEVLKEENLRSSTIGEISSKVFWKEEVYTYTPGSRIIFESSPKTGSIQIWNKTETGYIKQKPVVITDKSEITALIDFFMLSILSKDPALNDYPINTMFEIYTTGRTLEGDFSLSKKEAEAYKE